MSFWLCAAAKVYPSIHSSVPLTAIQSTRHFAVVTDVICLMQRLLHRQALWQQLSDHQPSSEPSAHMQKLQLSKDDQPPCAQATPGTAATSGDMGDAMKVAEGGTVSPTCATEISSDPERSSPVDVVGSPETEQVVSPAQPEGTSDPVDSSPDGVMLVSNPKHVHTPFGGAPSWPTPTPAAWEDIQSVAARASYTLDCLVRVSLHTNGSYQCFVVEGCCTLAHSLVSLLWDVLAGHVLDLNLDMHKVFTFGFLALLKALAGLAEQTVLNKLCWLFLKRLCVDQRLSPVHSGLYLWETESARTVEVIIAILGKFAAIELPTKLPL